GEGARDRLPHNAISVDQDFVEGSRHEITFV
ncbi:MAG: hypothetical protein ACI8S3_002028, partial [Alphaproteobacteria bacterium]